MANQSESRSAVPASGLHWFVRAIVAGACGYAIVGGDGPIMRAAGIAGLLLALLADLDGLTRHVCRACSLLAAAYAGPMFGGALGAWLSTKTGLPPAVGGVGGVVGAAVLAMVGVGLFGRLAGSLVRRSRFAALDRAAGALFGFGEGVAVVAAACWSAATFGPQIDAMKARAPSTAWTRPVFAGIDAFRKGMSSDGFARIALSYNPLTEMPMVRATQQLLTIASDPAAMRRVADSDALREFTQLPAVKRHLDALRGDATLRQAAEQRDLFAIMGSPQFAAMLRDGELHSALAGNYAQLQAALMAGAPAAPVAASHAPRPALRSAGLEPVPRPRRSN